MLASTLVWLLLSHHLDLSLPVARDGANWRHSLSLVYVHGKYVYSTLAVSQLEHGGASQDILGCEGTSGTWDFEQCPHWNMVGHPRTSWGVRDTWNLLCPGMGHVVI